LNINRESILGKEKRTKGGKEIRATGKIPEREAVLRRKRGGKMRHKEGGSKSQERKKQPRINGGIHPTIGKEREGKEKSPGPRKNHGPGRSRRCREL